MLKKLTYSKNSGIDITEVEFHEDFNLVKNPEIFTKFSVLKDLPTYSVLSSSTQASGDFVELEFTRESKTYFLTMYFENNVYEFYDDSDEDQVLQEQYISQVIKYSNFEKIFTDRLKEFDLGSHNVAAEVPMQVEEPKEDDKLAEINSKIGIIEKQLQDSKEFDNLQEEFNQSQKEIEDLKIRLGDYDSAKSKVEEAKNRKAQLGIIAQLNFDLFEKDLKALNEELRIKELQIANISDKKNIFDYNLKENKGVKSPVTLGILLILTALLALFAFLLVGLQGVLVGIIAVIVIAIWYFVPHTDFTNPNAIEANERDYETELTLVHKAKTDLLKMIGCETESEFYEKKAELQACDYEINHIDKVVKSRFEGENVEEALNKKVNLEKRIEELKLKATADVQNARLSSEDYLKKRRELDMLKMERIRTESSNRNRPSQIAKPKENSVLEISKDLMNIKDEIGLSDLQINDNKISADSMEDLYLGCIANTIQLTLEKKTVFPAILEDPFVFVSDFQRGKKIIDYFKDKLQIVLYAKHADYDAMGQIVNIKDERHENSEKNSDNFTPAGASDQ